jgi:glycosyltransferase involved in cell wall biosynthesis
MTAVSVVIPAYNAAATIGQAVDSALAQSWKDLEVIVVDDGSTDETGSIVDAYPSPVRCIHKSNEGVSMARNEGVERAEGRYVAFLDADDYWSPEKLERQVGLLEDEPDVGCCFTAVTRVDEALRPVARIPARRYPDYCRALLLESMVISTGSSSLMVRRGVIDEVGGFDPRFSQCADWDYAIRLSQATRIAPIDEPLVYYRAASGRMSSDIGLLERDTFAVLDNFFGQPRSALYAGDKRHIYSNHWMILAGSYLEAGARRDAVRCLMQGLRTYPPNVTRPAGLPWRRLKRSLA